jgi:hypothetical protein
MESPDGEKEPKDRGLAPPGADSSNVEHVTAHRVGVRQSDISVTPSGRFGCFGSLIPWTAGWLIVSWMAIGRVQQSQDLSAMVATIVSAGFSVIGCRVLFGLTRGGSNVAMVAHFSARGAGSRRSSSWLFAILLGVLAVLWNAGTFWILANLAARGRGFLMIFVSTWSVIGLLLLYFGILVIIDRVRRADEVI